VGVRNAADGKAARLGSLEARTLPGDVAKREPRTPWKALLVAIPAAGTKRRTLEGSEAHEGMKPFAKASGGRRTVKTAGSVGNDEDEAGVGNPIRPPAERIQDPEEP
jgi:hypothetical protein